MESDITHELKIDQSVAHNGICLTVVKIENKNYTVTAIKETIDKTSIGNWKVGDVVNLERAMKLGDRLDGHIVQGHVDGIGSVIENSPGEKWNKFVVRVPKNLTKYIVNQGSIAIDGVSITVGEISDDLLTLWLIPETLERTNLSQKSSGDIVNIEVDVIAKYVESLMNRGQS